jgi:GNAT superfamily N-acetyltransferase
MRVTRVVSRVEILEENVASLVEYARIPIAFEVLALVDARLSASSSAAFVLDERPSPTPFVKDYDAIPDNTPLDWPRRFDVASWGFLAARLDGVRVGGATVVFRCPAVDMLDARDDLAVLWDIRVAPGARGQGIGSALLSAAERWAADRGAWWLRIETQNINAPACRFYARSGYALLAVNQGAYPDLPQETQLLWYKEIGA